MKRARTLQARVNLLAQVSIEPEEDVLDDHGYADADKQYVRTYFNTNKIHCLRAKYIHGDKNAPEFYADNEALIKHPPKAS